MLDDSGRLRSVQSDLLRPSPSPACIRSIAWGWMHHYRVELERLSRAKRGVLLGDGVTYERHPIRQM